MPKPVFTPHHVHHETKKGNVEHTVQFYTQFLGGLPGETFEKDDATWCPVLIGNLTIMVTDRDAVTLSDHMKQRHHGIDHLAFAVDDFENALHRVQNSGWEITVGPQMQNEGTRHMFIFVGPDNVKFEILHDIAPA